MVDVKVGEPDMIVVSGSCIKAIHGEYRITGRSEDDSPVYTMAGRWEGKDVTFRVTHENTLSWVIEIEATQDFFLYRSAAKVPPCRGWSRHYPDATGYPPIVSHGPETIIDWRAVPDESLADYTIEIVHKKSLVVGQLRRNIMFIKPLLLTAASIFQVCSVEAMVYDLLWRPKIRQVA
jgi:hypothetical protein